LKGIFFENLTFTLLAIIIEKFFIIYPGSVNLKKI